MPGHNNAVAQGYPQDSDKSKKRTQGDISAYMAGKRWGDSGRAKVRRGDEEVELEIHFRRTLEDEDELEAEEEAR